MVVREGGEQRGGGQRGAGVGHVGVGIILSASCLLAFDLVLFYV